MNSIGLSPDTLYSHRAFIESIARALVRDAHGAEDIAQEVMTETWRRASPDRTFEMGWFATLARNFSRNRMTKDARRGQRDLAFAVSEESHDANTLERVETGHRVVAAVLALSDPYKQVILMRYFEDLSPNEIGKRLGVSAATVRSQLSRAQEKLRERLEPEFDSRRTFVLALARLATPTAKPVFGGFALLAAGTAILTATTLALALYPTNSEPPLSSLASGGAVVLAPVEPSVGHQDPAPVAIAAEDSVVREAIPQPNRQKAESFRSLLAEVAMVQSELRRKLLEPAPEYVRKAAALGPDGGAARVLDRNKFQNELRDPLGIRGFGAYFSFATRSNDFVDDPDLEFLGFKHGAFRSGFGERRFGCFVKLGDLPLESLGCDPSQPPSALDSENAERWKLLLGTQSGAEVAKVWKKMKHGPSLERRRQASVELDEVYRTSGANAANDLIVQQRMDEADGARVGRTYLLRSFLDGRHDLVAAFRTVAVDEYGYTIVWRVLKQFPVNPERERQFSGTVTPIESTPEIAAMDAKRLLARLAELRAEGSKALIEISEQGKREARAAAGFAEDDATIQVGRILPRGSYGAVVSEREGGAFLSFVTGSNDYDQQPTICLESDGFKSGFNGDSRGVVVDLGAVHLSAAESVMRDNSQAASVLAFDRRAVDPTKQSQEFTKHMNTQPWPNWMRSSPVEIGHCYLVTNVCDKSPPLEGLPAGVEIPNRDEPSVTAIFQPVARDEFGALTVVWRILEID